MFQNLRNKAASLGALTTGALVAAGSASAAAPDVSAVVTSITDAITPIGLIGAAVLTVLVAVKTYKWVRRAM